MSRLEWMETRRSYTDWRYDVFVTEYESLEGERRIEVTVKDKGREIFHTGNAILENFELETVEEYLRGVLEMREALMDFGEKVMK